MKKQLNLGIRLSLVAIVLLSLVNCKSTKEAVAPIIHGEVIIEQFCSGKEYQSTKDYFRSNAVGESLDQNVSKQKAMSNARAQLAQQIEITIKDVTDSYIKSVELNNVEDVEERFESLTREVTHQKLEGTKVICETMTKTSEGNYKTYIALELSSDEMVKAIGQRLSDDVKMRIDFNYERFKSTFDQEMNKLDKNN